MEQVSPVIQSVAILALCGIALSILFPIVKSCFALRWPKSTGKIISAKIDESTDVEGVRHYEVNIKYSYLVNGKKYISNNYAFGYWGVSWAWYAKRIVNQYTANQKISISYHPKNNQLSVMKTGLQFAHVFQIASVALIVCSV